MSKRVNTQKILCDPVLRKQLLDATIKATIAIGRDNTTVMQTPFLDPQSQPCGTCHWYDAYYSESRVGVCTPPLPPWVAENNHPTAGYNTGCPCWRQREEGEATK